MNACDGEASLGAGTERTARILIERYGARAFDFAARQLSILNLAGADASVDEWRAIATTIERLQALSPSRSTLAHREPERPVSHRG
jgi:hypothetical protein